MNEQADWYRVKNVQQADSPALLLYHERVINNIEHLIAMAGNPDLLRPHVKTNKSASVSRLMIERGITKFKCATIAEAEMLGQSGAKDVLLAYQPNKAKLGRFIELMGAYPGTKYSCLIDNIQTARMISDMAINHSLNVSVFIDLNVGMDRTGIVPDEALKLFNRIETLSGNETEEFPGIAFAGLHAYDGHIEDENIDERIAHCEREFKAVEQLRNDIKRMGYPFPLLVAGGSPTFAIHAKRANTECSPGTFVFWDKNYHDHIPEQHFLFAALVLTRVVSLPAEDKICIDLGYKAVACEKPLAVRVYFLNAPELMPCSHSEEHLVVQAPQGHPYKVGDVLYALPMHVCPTVAMYNQAHIIRNGMFTEKWAIDARGRELSI
ncbi:D-TA family PLP-dependent enzyme [Mucilaginibacter mali]|uniref:D-TA family PLP-dependent enzyme n=1 Tax=Mucilaginibacter mali TaxID=2740462 RepID=A0A7D4Q416_9SPHI|nr:D-TA family PLP-dependent enzyme [Mucilaginibacter mali]QKJ32646.1 D-TA family PLP-dependent enzyme [Mucilaginibacter mali]